MQAQDGHQREAAEHIIRRAQRILGRYLEPDSGLSPEGCINQLLDVLDGPEAAALERHRTEQPEAAKLRPHDTRLPAGS